MQRWILLGLWLCACGSDLRAAAGGRFTVKSFGADEGLPQLSVFALTQTRDGYLWLGTAQGLARFDGLRCTTFDDSNTPGLNGRWIVDLFEDSHTNLWIGTEAAGIALVRQGVVTNLSIGRAGPEGRLVAACEDSTGAVWLSTADGQLYRCREQKTELVHAGNCHALIAENSGLIWIAVERGLPGAGRFDTLFALGPFSPGTTTGFPVAYEVPVGRLDFLLATRRGGYWRLANGRVQKWRQDRMERELGPYPWKPNFQVRAACEDKQGNLVVGTYGDGVYWFDAQGKATHLSSELSHSFIFSLHVDREGCLWVGTDGGGLKRVRPQAFEILDKSIGLTIKSVCEDSQGGLWFGINNGGVDYWKDGALKEYKQKEGLADLYMPAVFVDRDQVVWAGTERGGLFQLHNGLFERAPGAELLDPHVSAFHQDRQGILWIGTQGGLARWDGKNWKIMTTRDGLCANAVQAIADDAQGGLWIGTSAGLNRLEGGRMTTFNRTNGLPGESVSCLYVDAEGVLWAATSGGLARFQSGKWTRYLKSDGLVSSAAGYLLEDGQGYLWIGSTAGLMRAEKKDLNAFANGTLTAIPWRTYGEQDGLPTPECTFGSQPAACRAHDGRLWFPTIRGLVSLDPSQLSRNTNLPPVVIESVLVGGQPQSTNSLRTAPLQSVTVPPDKELLEIHYTSLDLAAADQALFRYRLEGHETAWTFAQNRRVANYTKLPPRHYQFHVQACNEDGVWNEAGGMLLVTVLPPFWRTWWFLGASTLCLLGMIVGSVHYVSTQRLQQQLAALRQQEALEKERARIARDLHDQLGANLTQVALLGEMAEADKDLPREVEAHAHQISQTARDTTRALDEIVWTVNPSNDTLDGLINYICKYAQEYLALAGLRYRLEVPPELPATPISPELRHNVFLAAKEAVNNVVKHAQASSAWLRLRLDRASFTLEIEDDGRGLDGSKQKSGRNGLANMRKRMADIGGEFIIQARGQGGTSVQLTAPLNHRDNQNL